MSKLMVLAALAALAPVALASLPGCTYSVQSGEGDLVFEYDLSALNSGATPQLGFVAESNSTYHFQVCGELPLSYARAVCPEAPVGASMVQTNKTGSCLATNAVWASNVTWSVLNETNKAQGIKYTTASGTQCDNGGDLLPRIVTHEFVCDPNGKVFSPVTTTSDNSPNKCETTVTYKSRCACPDAGNDAACKAFKPEAKPGIKGCGASFLVDGNEERFDLSHIQVAGEAETFTDGAYTYKYQVCGALPAGDLDKSCPPAGDGSVPSMLQYKGKTCEAVMAQWKADEVTWSTVGVIEGVQYTTTADSGGSVCKVGGVSVPRTVTRRYICDTTAGDQATAKISRTFATEDACGVVVDFYSRCACPGAVCGGAPTKAKTGGSSGISGGWVFIILLFVTGFVYAVAGCVMNHGKGATGVEMCPNHDFWTGLPGLVRDGFRFVMGKAPAGGTQGGYVAH